MSLFPIASPIDALREYLSRMDIEMLDLILKEENTYNKLNKSLFLDKLDSIFDEFKKSGDTQLGIYHGECSNCFKRCRGYSLVGNKSAQYLDVLVKADADQIQDIFYCSDLVNYKDVEKSIPLFLTYELEEEADFKADEAFLILVNNCQTAIEELNTYKDHSIELPRITTWLHRHRDLYEDCIPYFMYSQHQAFFNLYHKLKMLFKIFKNKDRLVSEMLQLQNIILDGKYTENDMLAWLLRNETLGCSDTGKISQFVEGSEFRDGKILLNKEKSLFLSESDFKIFFIYESFFNRYYEEKIETYSIYNSSEIKAMDHESDAYKSARSLKFHIQERNKLGLKL